MDHLSSFMYYSLLNLLFYLSVIITMLIAVAFFTLFERKLLSYFHTRKGPNKASLMGITQPFADALKLLSKEFMYSPKMKYQLFIISPLFMMCIAIIMWLIFPMNNFYYLNYSLLLMFCCFSVSVYPVMIGGWSSNSIYALLGVMRSLSQTISYEVSLAIIIISPMYLCKTLNFMGFEEFQLFMNLGNWLWPTMTMLYVSSLAEVNRSPFDFIEGESELVSGFNVEYFSFSFAFIFLAEYSMIIWISGLNSIILYPTYYFIPMTLCYAYSMIWVRASVPRMRYDELMYLCWKIFLPASLLTLSICACATYFSAMSM